MFEPGLSNPHSRVRLYSREGTQCIHLCARTRVCTRAVGQMCRRYCTWWAERFSLLYCYQNGYLRENSFTKLNLQERSQNILPREFLQKRISFSLCDWLILSSIRGQTRKIACADVTSNSIFQARKVIDDDFSHFYPTINSLLIKALPAWPF